MKTPITFGQAIGTYSPALEVNGTLYVSGQIPAHPETGQIVGASFEEQARQVLANLHAVLNKAGYTKDEVVRVTVFLTDLNNFETLNTLFQEAFNEPYPTRSTVQVAALPKGVLVEIDAIATH